MGAAGADWRRRGGYRHHRTLNYLHHLEDRDRVASRRNDSATHGGDGLEIEQGHPRKPPHKPRPDDAQPECFTVLLSCPERFGT